MTNEEKRKRVEDLLTQARKHAFEMALAWELACSQVSALEEALARLQGS